MQDVREWAEILARRVGAEVHAEEDQTYTIDIPLDSEDDDEGDGVVITLPVTLYADSVEDDAVPPVSVIMLRAAAGDNVENLDLEEMLAVSSGTWFARLYLEAETDSFVAEAALPLDGLTDVMLEYAAREVADLASEGLDLTSDDDDVEDTEFEESDDDDEASDDNSDTEI